MRTLLIGATGQLGQDLLKALPEGTIALGHGEIDVTDGVGVSRIIREHRPDWVINTAAFHRVDDCELNPTLAFAVNATGAANVAKVCEELGAGVVFYSTDYVYGGEGRAKHHPHLEDDAPDPLNVYGISKAAGEQMVALANPRHLVIRSAGLYGTATSRKGWTFPELMINKARSDGKLKVVTDQTLSPTFTTDLAETTVALMRSGAIGLFHLTNAGECSWHEFASATVELAGIDVVVEPSTSVQQPRKAKRPPYSAMSSNRIASTGVAPMRPWREALAAYLHAKGFAPA